MSLTPVDQEVFDWVRTQTPPESRFLILTGEDPMSDPVSEWFPALTGRQSIATVQGHEWIPGGGFYAFLQSSREVQTCLNGPPSCLDTWLLQNQARFDYIYIRKSASSPAGPSSLEMLLMAGGQEHLVYDAPTAAILTSR